MDPMMKFQLVSVILMVIMSVLGYINASQRKKNAQAEKDKKQE